MKRLGLTPLAWLELDCSSAIQVTTQFCRRAHEDTGANRGKLAIKLKPSAAELEAEEARRQQLEAEQDNDCGALEHWLCAVVRSLRGGGSNGGQARVVSVLHLDSDKHSAAVSDDEEASSACVLSMLRGALILCEVVSSFKNTETSMGQRYAPHRDIMRRRRIHVQTAGAADEDTEMQAPLLMLTACRQRRHFTGAG